MKRKIGAPTQSEWPSRRCQIGVTRNGWPGPLIHLQRWPRCLFHGNYSPASGGALCSTQRFAPVSQPPLAAVAALSLALTAAQPTEPNAHPAVSLSGRAARHGRSQKDGLPLPPWGSTLVGGSRPELKPNPVAAENYYQHVEHYFRTSRRTEQNSREVSSSFRCENTGDDCNGLLTGRSKFFFIRHLRLGADAHSRKEPECRRHGKNSAQDQKEIAEH
jgi:predicted outer membrane repeat protein